MGETDPADVSDVTRVELTGRDRHPMPRLGALGGGHMGVVPEEFPDRRRGSHSVVEAVERAGQFAFDYRLHRADALQRGRVEFNEGQPSVQIRVGVRFFRGGGVGCHALRPFLARRREFTTRVAIAGGAWRRARTMARRPCVGLDLHGPIVLSEAAAQDAFALASQAAIIANSSSDGACRRSDGTIANPASRKGRKGR